MEIKDIKAVYFIGAGGIGMSAIARYFIHRGLVVAGYDKTPSALTLQLEREGMLIHYEENIDEIPHACKQPQTCLVIYTPAIPSDHQELQYFRQNGFEVEKRAQVLGTLTREHKGLCVAGTHGKTTTSTMCAHIMHQSHLDCNAFLGGISKNYGTNYILSNSDYVVIEADEFDRSFHWLSPWMSVITATDPDHLDIYGTKEAYLESFRHYTELIQPGGSLIIHRDLEMKENLQEGVNQYDYSLHEGDFHAENIRIGNGEITFDFISPIECVKDVQLGQPVPINIENGVAVIVRRDTREKITAAIEELPQKVAEVLEQEQHDMLERARAHRDAHTYEATEKEEFKKIADEKPGFIKAMWCGCQECEDAIKEEFGVTSRCIPFHQEQLSDKCIYCGRPATKMVYWGKAY